jgi:starch phosphorylase
MKPYATVTVTPSLPEALERLLDLAYNLRWSWDSETRALFCRLDRELWERCDRNPVRMLGSIDQARLDEAVGDAGFMAQYRRVCDSLDAYLADTDTWYQSTRHGRDGLAIAYFSAEFAVADCIPIYSGGLGVLAGDHLKSADNLGLPLVAVGLLYQSGYMRQYLNADGWQQESHAEYDFHTLPLRPVLRDGKVLTVSVPLELRQVIAQVWLAQVGRVPLYLLDTNLPENSPADRAITTRLYGGDKETRICQEIVLGVGGMRALEALGITPQVCHMNEGHCAFVALERIRLLMVRHGLSFAEAKTAVRAGHVFTTHTPVAAGNDYFPPGLVERYFARYAQELGLNMEAFLALGRMQPGADYCMTVLAMRLSAYNNGVSHLHQSVSRQMWAELWPQAPIDELPVSHVTNGVHAETWLSDEMTSLLDTYIGPTWRIRPDGGEVWRNVGQIPSAELWRTHERRRERLVAFARRRLHEQFGRRGAAPHEMAWADSVLDPQALTIGFARRFAVYKRPLLLFRDPERLARLLNDAARPVQLIFAGKAHPLDEPGKEMIRTLTHWIRQPQFRLRVLFLEDYDLDVARYMVQGADVWLNTPRRPLEASGTSGMKAALNGALNLSILDGWWDEAYEAGLGWAIGAGEEYGDEALQDQVEADSLYDLLEKEVVPLFYERREDRVPHYWVQRMRGSMAEYCPRFNTHRMVADYATRFYFPAHDHYVRLVSTGFEPARRLAQWKTRVAAGWVRVAVLDVVAGQQELRVGDHLPITARVCIDGLQPEDVAVQLCIGRVDGAGNLVEPRHIAMRPLNSDGDAWLFQAEVHLQGRSGRYGYTVRILPRHQELTHPWELGLVAMPY